MTDITRRTLITGAALAATAACTSPNRPTEAGTSTTPPSTMPVTPPQRRSGGGNVLLAYFSRAGENHWEGGRRNLDIGNTKVVAQHIADQIGCDVYEITAADLYPFAYSPTVERNQREQDRDDRPALAAAPSNLSRYTTVLLGSPVWNTRAPMIMRTLLDSTEALAGKTIHPFITYAVGGLGVRRLPPVLPGRHGQPRTGDPRRGSADRTSRRRGMAAETWPPYRVTESHSCRGRRGHGGSGRSLARHALRALRCRWSIRVTGTPTITTPTMRSPGYAPDGELVSGRRRVVQIYHRDECLCLHL